MEYLYNDDQISMGFGTKAVYLRADDRQDGGVVAIGGHLDYNLTDRLSVGGEGYYAPDMLSFHHVDRYLQYGANVGYNVVDNVIVNLGWRHTEFGYHKEDDLDYENNFYVGTKYRF